MCASAPGEISMRVVQRSKPADCEDVLRSQDAKTRQRANGALSIEILAESELSRVLV